MGRGDKKTKKGKIFKGSFGKSRPAKTRKTAAAKAN
jgi:30S ribosomal protein S31